MSKNIEVKCIIGASFGDEGKGLMTDYFCKGLIDKGCKNVLNIRYNGGHQASHTVVTPNRKRHIFNGLGAGSFNAGVDTYYSSKFMINFNSLEKELLSEVEFNNKSVYANKDCRVVLPYDIYLNVTREKKRGVNRHGTCSNGIFECVKRNKTEYGLRLYELYLGKEYVTKKIIDISSEYFVDELRSMGETDDDIYELECFSLDWVSSFVDALLEKKRYVIKVENEADFVSCYEGIVFEGAQGLMLDMDNAEYYPNLTPSKTGMSYILEVLKQLKLYELEVCYVTRAYNTRHGAGRLDGEVERKELGGKIAEYTNNTNLGQGKFRFGYLQLKDLGKHIVKDIENIGNGKRNISVCVTHLDQTNDKLITDSNKLNAYEYDFGKTLSEFADTELKLFKYYGSYGETREDIRVIK